jgi:PHP family Zn ribbon phosphoesterase
MIVVADLHIHSRFSRSCSKQINFRNLSHWCNIKVLIYWAQETLLTLCG